MKKIILLLSALLLSCNAFANEEILSKENEIQTKIDNIGVNILNSNKIEKRIVFIYDEKARENFLKLNKTLSKRQVVVYGNSYKFIENNDELAAFLSREIVSALRAHEGLGNGLLSAIKMKAAPKKYELVFDKIAIDYMVESGYNPLGLITFINKSCPQARQDKISNKNLTSKRLANIYEKIYIQYPYFLVNNEYLNNIHYQNFLLTSLENRKKVQQKALNPKENKGLKYE